MARCRAAVSKKLIKLLSRPQLNGLTLDLLPVSLSGVQVNFERHGGEGSGAQGLDQRHGAHTEGGTEGDLPRPACPPPG